jgi:hypothetical protein
LCLLQATCFDLYTGHLQAFLTRETTLKNANVTHKGAIKTSLKQGSADAKLPEQPTTALIRSGNQPNHVINANMTFNYTASEQKTPTHMGQAT